MSNDNSTSDNNAEGMTPEDAERMLQRVARARRVLKQYNHGTTLSAPVGGDTMLNMGQVILLDCQKSEEPEKPEK